MDNIFIYTFLEATLTDEQYSEYQQAFGIIEDFNYNDPYSDIFGMLMDGDNNTTNAKIDFIYSKVHTILNHILKEHQLVLSGDASMDIKIKILRSFFDLQHLDLYEVLSNIVYGTDDVEEAVALVVEEISGLEYTTTMEAFSYVSSDLLNYLRTFIDGKITNTVENNKDILDRLKVYFKVVGQGNVVKDMLDKELVVGVNIETYVPYITGIEKHTVLEVAIDIIGIILYSGVCYSDVLDTYREHSGEFLHDLVTISRVDIAISKLVGDLTNYKEALTEADRSIT